MICEFINWIKKAVSKSVSTWYRCEIDASPWLSGKLITWENNIDRETNTSSMETEQNRTWKNVVRLDPPPTNLLMDDGNPSLYRKINKQKSHTCVFVAWIDASHGTLSLRLNLNNIALSSNSHGFVLLILKFVFQSGSAF